MDFRSTLPIIVLFLGLGFILFSLCGIIAWTIRISLRLNKMDAPKIKPLYLISFLQILAGVIMVLVVRTIKDEPFIALGIGLFLTLLSGILFIKLILKKDWKQSLHLWGIAVALQLALLPVCSLVMSVAWVMFIIWLYPPQY